MSAAAVVLGGSAYDWEAPQREAWMDDAACANTDPDQFFPEKGGSTRDAKKICGGCDVRQQCLEYALRRDERFGIWGGLSERERRPLRRAAAPAEVVRTEPRKQRWTWTDEADQVLREMREQLKSDAAIAGRLGISPPTVTKRRKALGFESLPSGWKAKRGEREVAKPSVPGFRPEELVRPVPQIEEEIVMEQSTVEKRRGGRKPAPHGTNTHWSKYGCRDAATCPGGEGGVTCAAAHEAWLAARTTVGAPVRTSEEIPTPQTAAEDSETIGIALHDAEPGEPVEFVVGSPDLTPSGFIDLVAIGFPRVPDDEIREPAPDLESAQYAEVVRFGIHDDVDEQESAAAVAAHTAEASLGDLRARFGEYNPGGGDRAHGGLLEDLRITRIRLVEAQEMVGRLERELGAARATIEAVRVAEQMRDRAAEATLEEFTALAGLPVAVQVSFEDGRLSGVRVEVAA